MQNHNGYSPIQLVLGTNPNLPSVSTNRLPAMETPEKSEAVTAFDCSTCYQEGIYES